MCWRSADQQDRQAAQCLLSKLCYGGCSMRMLVGLSAEVDLKLLKLLVEVATSKSLHQELQKLEVHLC